MCDYFGNRRKGHIGPHAYPGQGGIYYDQWLAAHRLYDEVVTQPELKLISHFAESAAEIFGDTTNFVEGGIGSWKAFQAKTLVWLLKIAEQRKGKIQFTVADIASDPFDVVRSEISAQGLPLDAKLIQRNMFNDLPKLPPNSAIWISGITLTNPPVDALKSSPEDIFTDIFSYYHGVLSTGGILAFTYPNNKGISSDGREVIALYNHPLNNLYQLSIYPRVPNELDLIGDFDPNAFANPLDFTWHNERQLLTRRTHPTRVMEFGIGNESFILTPDFDGYHCNNFRPEDDLIRSSSRRAGFSSTRIIGLPDSNISVAVLFNG